MRGKRTTPYEVYVTSEDTAGESLSLTARRCAARFFFRVGAGWAARGRPTSSNTKKSCEAPQALRSQGRDSPAVSLSMKGAHEAKKLLHELIHCLYHDACLTNGQQFFSLFPLQFIMRSSACSLPCVQRSGPHPVQLVAA